MNRARLSQLALLIALGITATPLQAAVEFVTRIGNACNKVDTIGDGKDLSLQAGPNIQFEVWGDGIDIRKEVRLTSDDSNAGTVSARILRAHGGLENTGRSCKQNKGSVEVEVDSPANTTQILQRSLRFKMPAGDESRLQVRVVPFRQPVWTWDAGPLLQSPANCLTKNVGTVVVDNQSTRLTITLPAGADADTSNCNLDFRTTLQPADTPEVDIGATFAYAVTGAPSYLTLVNGTNSTNSPIVRINPRFSGAVADIRSTKAALPTRGNLTLTKSVGGKRTSTLTAATPNALTDTLVVVIEPPPIANAFTQGVVCRNQQTGTTVNVNDAFDCELHLAQTPPSSGQLISFEVQDRLCVAAGNTSVTYSSATGVGTFTAPASGTIHQIPLRALGGQASSGSPCASNDSPVAHTLKFWVGPRDTESGPDFSKTQIRIRSPL